MKFQPGDILDEKYKIVRLLGEGGMGSVYEGKNVRIGRRVAIKVLNADIAASQEMKKRFEMEAQVAAKIGSPYICDVLDLGDIEGGHSYLVMEYLEGEGLDQLIERQGKMTPEQLSLLAFQLLEALGAMHAAGIIHRDIKPANAFVARGTTVSGARDVLKLLDFGISKFQSDEAAKQVTQTGALLGTPVYMSPEQARGERVDGRSDIYSVGVILYRALTGRLPFEGENFQQLLFKIALETAPSIAELAPDVDPEFQAIVERAMSKAAADRFADAYEFQRALVEWAKIHGQSSLAYQKATRSSPPAPSAQLLAADAFKSGRRAGLDEKSAPTAWGKGEPATGSARASNPDVKPVDAKTPAPTPQAIAIGALPPDSPSGSLAETMAEEGVSRSQREKAALSPQAKSIDPSPAAVAKKEKSKTVLYGAGAAIAAIVLVVGYTQFTKSSANAGAGAGGHDQAAHVGADSTLPATTTPLATTASASAAPVDSSAAATTPVAPSTSASAPIAQTAPIRTTQRAPGNPTTLATAAPSASAPHPAVTASAEPAASSKAGRKIRTEL